MFLTPLVAIHMTCALIAVAVGPVALWARLGRRQHPIVHRAFGYAWVTLMILVAVSAIFIRGGSGPRWAGFSPIHLLIPFVLLNLAAAFYALSRGRVEAHRRHMQYTYFGSCVVAGLFTLVPGRLLGDWLWHTTLGLI
jgi:uncharacterized membrane protein